jgi:hypothetical protein
MRARRREINIFNMSLLDILCGALGAFCFMMLVALPYYKPGAGSSAQLRENQQKTDELMRELEKLKERMGEAGAAEDLDDLLRKLQAQIQSLQGQVNQLTAENEQLKTKNEQQARRLEQKKPFLIISVAIDTSQELDIYVEDDLVAEGKDRSANPPFDPKKPWHVSNWMNDITGIFVPNRGVVVWIGSETGPGAHYKIYLKYATEPKLRKPTSTSSTAYGDFGNTRMAKLPVLTLTPERFWTFLGTINIDDNFKMSWKEATEEERDQEWTRVMKSPPPPIVMTTPVAAATPGPATASPSATLSEERRAALERLRQEQQQKQQAVPPAKSTEEERRALIDKMRREQEQSGPGGQSPPVGASPTPPSRNVLGGDQERLEKLRREREQRQRQTTPAPSVSP